MPATLSRLFADIHLQAMRNAQEELSTCKDRLRSLESQSSKDSRSTGRSTADYRDQLSERNALLQTVYLSIEKLTGTDRVSFIIMATTLQCLNGDANFAFSGRPVHPSLDPTVTSQHFTTALWHACAASHSSSRSLTEGQRILKQNSPNRFRMHPGICR